MAKKPATSEAYIKKFQTADRQRLTRVRNLRAEARADEGIDPLDQAVLGVTGSPEELVKYRALAERIGDLAGQPVLYIEEFRRPRRDEDERITKAKGGILTGRITVDMRDNLLGPHDERTPSSFYTTIAAGVDPIMSYLYYRDGAAEGPHNYYFGDQHDANKEKWVVPVANFVLEEGRNKTVDPSADYSNRVLEDQLAMGNQAIYDHPLFQGGLSRLLLQLQAGDPRVAEQA